MKLPHIYLPFLKQEVIKLLQRALLRTSLLIVSKFLQLHIQDSMKAYKIIRMITYSSIEPIEFATLVSPRQRHL